MFYCRCMMTIFPESALKILPGIPFSCERQKVFRPYIFGDYRLPDPLQFQDMFR